MNLKNAVAICLISFFSAALVVLIARSLDLDAASRIEPQLAKIVEQLEAIRKSGTAGPAGLPASDRRQASGDVLVVYYFHSKQRCQTCRSIETQALATVQSDFADELASGKLVWKVLCYEEPSVAELAERFDVQVPVVVLARQRDGEIQRWKRLDQVWDLVEDKPAFARLMRAEIHRMLE